MSGLWLRLVTGVLLIASGAVHAELYLRGYRAVPVIGSMFLLQAGGAVVVGLLLLVTNSGLLRLAGAALAAGALGGFVLSRTVGVFGFVERGFQPAPQALLSVIVEVVALVCLAVPAVAALRGRVALRR